MRALASFVSSPTAAIYGKVCEKWGRDPAAFLETEDDVLAFDFRAALALAMSQDEEPDAMAEHDALVSRARGAGTVVQRALSG